MGKGDKKTRRGKIVIGSFGVRRKHGKKSVHPGKKMRPVPIEQIEEKPVIVAPEPEVPIEISEPKTTKKTPVKKTAAKKTAEKPEKEEVKTKTTKSKKKSVPPSDDLFTTKKDEEKPQE